MFITKDNDSGVSQEYFVVKKEGGTYGMSIKHFLEIGNNKDLFASKANVLVCPTNGSGAMGKGLALTFNQLYPGLKTAYAKACRRGDQEPGKLFFWQADDSTVICCLPTKRDWRDPSTYADVYAGITTLAEIQAQFQLHVAVPPLGCGLGTLSWKEVKGFLIETMDTSLTDICAGIRK